ncbi:TetR/AcrR family transcriptional regulator C-terminal domain-containing protein [Actinokineospora sp. NBRC 105648]|uniref:TetR/AcrR family transcriptional regulator C-terminal domain-containing protein n=1 Tax=Actinokineospora sp. NBRC 105648 TaxID=3032206 RepID=UPI0024A051AC|nr:TetR/AcrR family transcriptional regulator C-terminal domain-containing protein [Actinokineospora sp. NBRC 105648]GLZ38180.1 GntR family transcriptional regulator [Actinokineospora sp. NBRC 105648]
MEATYARVAADIRRRIEEGELAPGDRVPSTRQITKEWGVALATAAKALQALTQEGLVQAVPRVGTIVTTIDIPARPVRREVELSRERVVDAAIGIADAEGLDALSMRGVAAKLGVATMATYRHVDSKDDLILLMMEAALGEDPFPAERPSHWRAGLEFAARLEWRIYRRHPWLAQAISLTRPQLLPNALAHTEWMLTAMDGVGLPPDRAIYSCITVFNYVRSTAVNLEWEREAESATGLTDQEWLDNQQGAFERLMASGAYPTFARMTDDGVDFDMVLDELFEFGLLRLLDGLAVFIERGGRD